MGVGSGEHPRIGQRHFRCGGSLSPIGSSTRSRAITVHIIKDLSEWAPQRGAAWEPEKEELLKRFCSSIFEPDCPDVFLIAANDGQLVESWRRLTDGPHVGVLGTR